MLLALAAFYTAYKGVLLFEGRLHISRGIAYIIAAALMLVVAGWPRRARALAPGDAPEAAPEPQARQAAEARRWGAVVPGPGWGGLFLAGLRVGFCLPA